MLIDPALSSQISWGEVYFYRKATEHTQIQRWTDEGLLWIKFTERQESSERKRENLFEADRANDDWTYLFIISILMWHLALNWFQDEMIATHQRSNYWWQNKWDKSESSPLSSNAMWSHIYVTELSTMNTAVTIIIIISWLVWKLVCNYISGLLRINIYTYWFNLSY
jgi:hypothetical protein